MLIVSWLEREREGACMHVISVSTVLDTMKAHIFVLHLHLFSTN